MVFVESPWFSVWRDKFLTDELFSALLNALHANPEVGALIPGSRGLRKVRLALPGRGKRGGSRVIYFHWTSRERVYLLFGYAKNVQADLTKDQIRRLVAVMQEDVGNG
jgi:hypothetical protein